MTDRSIVGLHGVYEIIGLMIKDACESYLDINFIRKPKPTDSYEKIQNHLQSGKQRYNAYMFLKTSHFVSGADVDGIEILRSFIEMEISKQLNRQRKNFPYIKWLREELKTILRGITPCFLPKYDELALQYKHIKHCESMRIAEERRNSNG